MPKINGNTPKTPPSLPSLNSEKRLLRPFSFHGVQLVEREGGQAVGDCPFCAREGKFWVKAATGQWDCKVCKAEGNLILFLRQLWAASDKSTKDYEQLSAGRSLLYPDTLMHWGVCRSISNRDWLVPGYSEDGRLCQLYRYLKDPISGKMRLLPTPEIGGHGIHGANLFNPKKPDLYLCEGPWDGMALWESLRTTKLVGEDLQSTGSESSSLYFSANVLAIPGCGSVGSPFQKWLHLFKGKRVFMLFDNDHERIHPRTGQVIEPAGLNASRRAAELLTHAAEPPEEIHYLNWGPQGFDPTLPSGYDVRDLLSAGKTSVDRVPLLGMMLKAITPIPEAWAAGRSRSTSSTGAVNLELIPCDEYSVLQNSWRKAMKWIEGLDRALSVMLAAVVSTKAVGDQLWVKIIGPAACGKSTLCDALNVHKKYVKSVSVMTGFHSGYKETGNANEDNSLIAQLYDKTLITKDGDTLMRAPNRDQILAEARDIFDRTSTSFYRNKMGKSYNGVNITWILCGTGSLREMDSSELGGRFLDCVIMHGIDSDLEDEIMWRVVNRASQGLNYESDGKLETRYTPELVNAMQMTGGYVDYLRENAATIFRNIERTPAALMECARLGILVSYMRARPSKKQDETKEREFGSRLGSQLTRLAICLAAVLNKPSIDAEVMRRVKLVALDTAAGKTLEIARHLYSGGMNGRSTAAIAAYASEGEDKTRNLLRFMQSIGATEWFHTAGKQVRWRLTPRMTKLYQETL